jgi:hypothetical protein
MAKGISVGRDSEWMAKADLEILLEAERIKRDSKRFAAAQKCAKKRKEELARDMGSVASIEEKK